MSSEVRTLLLQIGKELGRTDAQMEPAIAKLEDQWYDSLDSLRAITDWAPLGLPQRLVDEIQKRIRPVGNGGGSPRVANAAGTANAVAGGPKPTPEAVSQHSGGHVLGGGSCSSSSSSKGPHGATTATSPNKWDLAPENVPLGEAVGDLEALAVKLVSSSSSNNGADVSTCVATVFKLLHAVLKNPEDDAKRSINLANENFHQRVGRFAPAIEFLQTSGFQKLQTENKLVMRKAYISRLTDAHNFLAQAVQQSNISVSIIPALPMKFNPFQSSFSSIAASQTGRPVGKMAEKRSQEAAQLAEELAQKRQQLEAMERPDQAMDDNVASFLLGPPKLCWTQDLGSLKDAIKASAEEFMEDGETDDAIIRDLVRGMQGTGAGNFKAREKSELADFQRRKVYQVVLIRILFPNKMIFEVKCRPNETVKALYRKVETILRLKADTDFYLYDTPPIRKFSPSSRKTLTQEGLAPGSNLHLGLVTESALLQQYAQTKLASNGASSSYSNNTRTVSTVALPMQPEYYLTAEALALLPPEPKPMDITPAASSSHASGNSQQSRLLGEAASASNGRALGNPTSKPFPRAA
ncbi:unnamed protein product [Amoebophrya sp. A25]|nr:unnamed protein product [Amoebophrya sp. A25]|eukprot:GSA25T00002716001.1